MEYIVGIDGGGTKTVMRAATLTGELLYRCEGGTSNINVKDADYVYKVLHETTLRLLGKLNEPMDHCRSLCMGAAGADRDDDKKMMLDILRKVGFTCPIHITNDALIALWEGANGEGLLVEAGTGSICYGRNHSGQVARSGGWGHIIGDEGSAYDIAIKALNSITRSADGRDGATILTNLVLESLQLSKETELIRWIYRSNKGKTEIAQIAKIVDDAADLGDPKALEILHEAGADLKCCADAVIKKLRFSNQPFTTVMAGSILLKSKYVSLYFQQSMKEQYPKTSFKPLGDKDAAYGSILLALHKLQNT